VSAQLLATRGEPLCQLHGQHEHQVLRAPGAARSLLDRSGSIDDVGVRALRGERTQLLAQRDRLGGAADERARRLDLLAHECAEIDAIAPEGPDEIEQLLEEVAALTAILDAKDALSRAAATLDNDDGDEALSAADLLARALGVLPRSMEAHRDELSGLLERTRALSARLHVELGAADDDPGRLDWLNGRITGLQALVRKHGHSLADVLSERVALGAELERLEDDDVRSRELDDELGVLEAKLADAEAELLARRTVAAGGLAAGVQARLASLAMPQARFDVAVAGSAGEQVAFLFAGSDAFEPAPLADAASGGELSRVMLALTLASRSGASTMVFDEVDAGVGGATALSLASCLAEVARHRQVLVVTHLATVAAAATHHVVVTRGVTADDPTSVEVVDGDARVREIARMLAGDPDDAVALAHATALLTGDPVSS
jgi:DNA repair protein RecN (Recombination protein N)